MLKKRSPSREVKSPGPLVLLLVGLGLVCGRAQAAVESAAPPVQYAIIVTGDELLAGAYADGHTFFLTRTLRPLGLQCVAAMFVDDSRPDIQEALRFATGKAGLVIVTGGLGPTDNDVTREALRDFTGIPLREQPDVLAEMAQRFKTPANELRANLRRQTQVPTQGTYLKNANGTAVGLVFQTADKVIVALPGPPRELQPMVRDELLPYLGRRFGVHTSGCALTLRFVGLGQSQIDQTLKDHVSLPADVITSSQFDGARVDFTFSLPHDTPAERARLRKLKEEIARYLGDSIYADDEKTSLEDCVVRLLENRKATLALAEAGSGGALAAALNSADGAPYVLAGAYVAPTEEKLAGLLGARAEFSGNDAGLARLARATAEATQSSWAVAIGEIRHGEKDAPFVEVAWRSPDGQAESRPVRLQGSGEPARARLVTELLDQLRRKLR
jgi:nicotinamide-nucleotide amidase